MQYTIRFANKWERTLILTSDATGILFAKHYYGSYEKTDYSVIKHNKGDYITHLAPERKKDNSTAGIINQEHNSWKQIIYFFFWRYL